jgi:hypothetical protein
MNFQEFKRMIEDPSLLIHRPSADWWVWRSQEDEVAIEMALPVAAGAARTFNVILPSFLFYNNQTKEDAMCHFYKWSPVCKCLYFPLILIKKFQIV